MKKGRLTIIVLSSFTLGALLGIMIYSQFANPGKAYLKKLEKTEKTHEETSKKATQNIAEMLKKSGQHTEWILKEFEKDKEEILKMFEQTHLTDDYYDARIKHHLGKYLDHTEVTLKKMIERNMEKALKKLDKVLISIKPAKPPNPIM